jgi:hypothetical protein
MSESINNKRKRDNNDFISFLKNNERISPDRKKCNFAHYLIENMNGSLEFLHFEELFYKPEFPYKMFTHDDYSFYTQYAFDAFRQWCNSQPKSRNHIEKYAYELIGMTTIKSILTHFLNQPDYEKILSKKIYIDLASFEEKLSFIISCKFNTQIILYESHYFAFFPHEIRSIYDNCILSLQYGNPHDYIYWLLPEHQIIEILSTCDSLWFGDEPSEFEKECIELCNRRRERSHSQIEINIEVQEKIILPTP